ncbi:MAG: cache domain-containing protein [Verrucomicrobiae bacterium]|nr:cache domain-containing protein [Verrucomicrobiae bacterium]MDW7979407.1 cache domain-containing protein [Verrucomicrobiales bacterium]
MVRALLQWLDKSSIRIGTKLVLSFLLVIILVSVLFSIVGVRVIGDRVVKEAQAKVQTDLNAAREIYLNKLADVNDVVRFTADRYLLMSALMAGNTAEAAEVLGRLRERERLDVLTVTDARGRVILRTSNPGVVGDDKSGDEFVRAALEGREPVASTCVVPAEELARESPELAARAYFKFIPTPMARPRVETEETAGMMLKAAAPILDPQGNVIGAIYGGILLNRNFEIVDKIKETVFQNVQYKGKDIGTATLFLDDLRISTNVRNQDGTRAIGTRLSEEVYNRVIGEGKQWIGRAFVVNDWYITAYEPIRDLAGRNIGILYVGLLEQKYADLHRNSVLVFLAITLGGAAGAFGLAWYLSQRLSDSVRKLARAAEQVAHGNLDVRVQIESHDELRELAEAFNYMAAALKKRDEQLREFTTRRIMESERLAHIGQLAAGVAHEINNPLQGIVTYSHLLLERARPDDANREFLEKIVKQADRCRNIIRGLLDFARQRKPEKRLSNVNRVVEECLGLVANQALFHNIKIVRNLAPDLPLLLMDPSQMQQVFMNMIINAAEAMNGAGQLTVTTRHVPDASAVEIEFTDTGHGIKEEDMERIFDPFFTTKEAGHGTGLGLAISYGIVKEHKGTITVQSEVGRGTTFTIRLPVSAVEQEAQVHGTATENTSH